MVECFAEVYGRRGLKVNANKSRVVGRREWNMKSMWMGHDWRKCQSSNIWGVLDKSGTNVS